MASSLVSGMDNSGRRGRASALLSVSERAVPFQDLHEHIVRGAEIAELALQLVLPLYPVEEVVAVAEDDDEDGRDAAAWVVVAAVDHGAHQGLSVGIPEMQMVEVIGEGAIGEIALPEIGEFGVEGVSVEHPGVLPSLDRIADRLDIALGVEDPRLEQVPE